MEKTRGMGREVRYGSPLTATATATTDTTQTHSVFLSYFFKAILISSCVITPSPSVSNWENALMSACSVGFFQFVMSRRSAWKGKGRGSQVSWKVLATRSFHRTTLPISCLLDRSCVPHRYSPERGPKTCWLVHLVLLQTLSRSLSPWQVKRDHILTSATVKSSGRYMRAVGVRFRFTGRVFLRPLDHGS